MASPILLPSDIPTDSDYFEVSIAPRCVFRRNGRDVVPFYLVSPEDVLIARIDAGLPVVERADGSDHGRRLTTGFDK